MDGEDNVLGSNLEDDGTGTSKAPEVPAGPNGASGYPRRPSPPKASSGHVIGRLFLVPLPFFLAVASFRTHSSLLWLPGVVACIPLSIAMYRKTWQRLSTDQRKEIGAQVLLLAVLFALLLFAIPAFLYTLIAGGASSYDYVTPLVGLGLAFLVIPLVPYTTAIIAYAILAGIHRSQSRFFRVGSILLSAWIAQFLALGIGNIWLHSYDSRMKDLSGGYPSCYAVSPNDAHAAWANANGEVTIQRIQFPHLPKTWKGGQSGTRTLAYSPDGRYLASGATDHTIAIWDTASQAKLCTLHSAEFPLSGMSRYRSGDSDIPDSLSFSPRGDLLVAGCTGGQALFLWHLPDGREVRSFAWAPDRFGRDVGAVAFQPDGRSFLSGHSDGRVLQWDPATGELIRDLPSPVRGAGAVRGISFWDDHVAIVSYSNETVCAWDLTKGTMLFQVEWAGSHAIPVPRKNIIVCESGIRMAIVGYTSGRVVERSEFRPADAFNAAGVTSDGETLIMLQGEKIFTRALKKAI